jgi:hypothetical protein
VNRAKLKFTKLITTTRRVSVRNIIKFAREKVQNKSQANKESDTRICFTEVRFSQTYSPLRRPQRPGLFQPLPSLTQSLGPSELSLLKSTGNKTSPQGPPHNWCLLPWLQLSFDHKQEHNKSLSLNTKAFVELGEDLITWVCLVLNA